MANRFTVEPVGGAELSWLPFVSYPMFQSLEGFVRSSLATKDMGTVISCVVMAAACAESYANELAHMTFGDDLQTHKEYTKLDTNVVAKYRYLALKKGVPFTEDKDPFASFQLLTGLRGSLMHYQVAPEPIESQKTRLENQLAKRFGHKDGDVSYVRILTGACANWALTTAFDMIRYLYEIGYEPPAVAWFEALHPGFRERFADDRPEGVYKIRDIARG